MSARRFRKRIEVWQTLEVADGYGGFTVSEQLITTTWADLKTIDSKKQNTDFGVNTNQLAVMCTVRKRNDFYYNTLNQFIKYAGNKYTIISFPENKNFDNSFITFIAVKEDLKAANIVTPIDSASIYTNYESRVTPNGGTELNQTCQTEFIQDLLEL